MANRRKSLCDWAVGFNDWLETLCSFSLRNLEINRSVERLPGARVSLIFVNCPAASSTSSGDACAYLSYEPRRVFYLAAVFCDALWVIKPVSNQEKIYSF